MNEWDHDVDAMIILSSKIDPNEIKGPFPNEHSARLRSPGEFKEAPDWSTGGKFRRTKDGIIFGRIKVPNTVSVIWGQLKTQRGRAAAPQSLRFPKSNWTVDRAKSWLKRNNIKVILFEPAGPSNSIELKDNHSQVDISKNWFRIEDKHDTSSVFIYDSIGSYGVSASSFINEFNKIKLKQVDLHIDSPGGIVHMGMAIFNNIKNSDKNVHVFIDGLAASMGSVIAMAGDEITMPENALLMIHNPISIQIGNSKDMRKEADLLDKIQGQIAQIYADKSEKSIEAIKAKMDEETWFDGGEALDFGLVDNNAGKIRRAAHYNIDNTGDFQFKKLDKLIKFMNISNRNAVQVNPNQNGGLIMEPKTIAELKAKYPALCVELEQQVKDGLDSEYQTGLQAAEENGAKKERERISGINSIKITGEAGKKIQEEALKDPKATKETVAIKLLESQAAGNSIKIENRQQDSQTLANALSSIDNVPPGGSSTLDEHKQDEEACKAAATAAGVGYPNQATIMN